MRWNWNGVFKFWNNIPMWLHNPSKFPQTSQIKGTSPQTSRYQSDQTQKHHHNKPILQALMTSKLYSRFRFNICALAFVQISQDPTLETLLVQDDLNQQSRRENFSSSAAHLRSREDAMFITWSFETAGQL